MSKDRTHQRPWLPQWVVLPATLALVFLALPFLALVLRVPWTSIPTLMETEAARDALRVSMITCLSATALCLILGVPLATWLARAGDSWLARICRIAVTIPMVLPPVVAGLILLITWGRRGLLGQHLEILGIDIAFSTVAVVLAQTFVSLPFLVTSFEAALRTRGFHLEAAARSLGASRTRTLLQVTLPLSLPALVSATALALARALGEFGATLTFAGSLQGRTRTLPLEVYLQREVDTDLALALSVVLVGIAVVVLSLTGATGRLIQRWQTGPSSPPGKPRSVDSPEWTSPESAPVNIPQHSLVEAGFGARVQACLPERRVDLDLEIPGGRFTALVGPNGAGKTTLLQVLAGNLSGPQTSVRWDSARRPRLAILEQNPALFPHLSVLGNVIFAMRCQGISAEHARQSARQQLRALGIEHLAAKRPNQLSGGQAQRVALARALSVRPQVVLLDEPMSGLDIAVAQELRRVLSTVLAGATVVVVTHDLADVQALDCHVVLLRSGRVSRSGDWDQMVLNSEDDFISSLARKLVLESAYRVSSAED